MTKVRRTLGVLVEWLCRFRMLDGCFWRPIRRIVNYHDRVRDSASLGIGGQGGVLSQVEFAVKLSPELKVLNGPFRGMRYPEAKSVGSSLVNKILGCYEMELHLVVERLCGNQYELVLDIGCAEGYYANGFAMRMDGASVIAFDIDEEGRDLCRKMAAINNQAVKVDVRGVCDGSVLEKLLIGKKALIFSDCEGYEKTLFPSVKAELMKDCDIVIEVHDCFDHTISTVLKGHFAMTHRLEVVRSIPDAERPAAISIPECQGLSDATRLQLYAESRGAAMEWFVFSPF